MTKPELYNDLHPDKSLKNTGYKDKITALKTIKLVEKRSLKYQFDVINTMYNRAKFHKNKTKDMEEAMEIFNIWLNDYDKKKTKEDSLYKFLDVSKIKKIDNLIDIYKLSNKSKNFYEIYKSVDYKKHKLQYILVKENKPDGYDYYSYRIKYIKSKLDKMKKNKLPFFYTNGKYKNLPTKDHLMLIIHAFSPFENYL